MSPADQPRRVPSAHAAVSDALCRTCGAITYGLDECANCRDEPTQRHPFIPTTRRVDAHETNASHVRGVNGRAPHRIGGGQAMKEDASEMTNGGGGATADSSANGRPGATTTTTRSATQPSAAAKRPHKTREVIDLISSDEENEDHRRRAAKRARQVARMQKSNARLALHNVDSQEEDNVIPMAVAATDSDERIRREPPQSRSFGVVEFNEDDFPSAEQLQLLRGRPSSSTMANSATSSTVSTPTSSSSVPPPPSSRVPVSASIPSTEPTRTRVTSATTTRTATTTTTKSPAVIVNLTRDDDTPNATSRPNAATEQTTQVPQASPASESREPSSSVPSSPSNTASTAADVAVAALQPTTVSVTSSSSTPLSVTQPEISKEEASPSLPNSAAISEPASSDVPTAAPPSPRQAPSGATREGSATGTAIAPTSEPSAEPARYPPSVSASHAASLVQPRAAESISVAEQSVPTSSATELPELKPLAEKRSGAQSDHASPPIASTTESEPAVPTIRAAHDPISPEDLIVLDECDNENDEETGEEGGPALFQSRRFQSVVFNACDFMTVNEGLNLARRSNSVAHIPVSPVAKSEGGTSSVLPAAVDVPPAAHTESTTSINRSQEQDALPSGATTQTNILQPRRKPSPSEPSSSAQQGETSTSLPAIIKIEHPAFQRPVAVRRIIKPTLGYCSTEFLNFMRNCVDGDDEDDDEDELARAKLLEVVDLTHLSGDSADDDDDDEDYFEIVEAVDPSPDVPSQSRDPNVEESSVAGNEVSSGKDDVKSAENGTSPAIPPVVKRTRAPRPKETCAICEERAWIRVLVQCPDCKNYYHKKCAREYGDENVCYMCEAEGIIDDSELTDEHKEEFIGLFEALRQVSDSETGDDADADVEDADENDSAPVVDQAVLARTVATTKSTRRWREFLDVSTAPVEESFKRVTSRISQDLLDEERKRNYTRGFVLKEEFERDMTEVLEHYAGLQDREERRLREERSRAPPTEAPSSDQLATADPLPEVTPAPLETTVEHPSRTDASVQPE